MSGSVPNVSLVVEGAEREEAQQEKKKKHNIHRDFFLRYKCFSL